MTDKRNAKRRNLGEGQLVIAYINGNEVVVRVLDVSPEGMRIRVPEFLNEGVTIYCKLEIYPDTPPFYIKGTIVRVSMIKGQVEAGVKFDLVRVFNFFKENKE
jgi:hypothetical protein